MSFTFSLEKAEVDQEAGTIVVPIETDIPIDHIWKEEVRDAIDSYESRISRDPWGEPHCIVEINGGMSITIRGNPDDKLLQNVLDTQKRLLMQFSAPSTARLNTRLEEDRREEERLKKAQAQAPSVLERLRKLKG